MSPNLSACSGFNWVRLSPRALRTARSSHFTDAETDATEGPVVSHPALEASAGTDRTHARPPPSLLPATAAWHTAGARVPAKWRALPGKTPIRIFNWQLSTSSETCDLWPCPGPGGLGLVLQQRRHPVLRSPVLCNNMVTPEATPIGGHYHPRPEQACPEAEGPRVPGSQYGQGHAACKLPKWGRESGCHPHICEMRQHANLCTSNSVL